jgi:NAD(P)-dependent dehydrogenase (short-subunit alcohol dehydrogenase family)
MASNERVNPIDGQRLDGKVALVTGASSGIGRVAALAFAEAGAKVCAHGQSHIEEAEAVAERIKADGGEAIAIKADLTDREQIDAMVDAAVEEFGGVDIALCNAGIFHIGMLADHTDEMWQQTLDVNVSGAFYTTRRVVPEMRKRGGGRLLYTGSIFGPYGTSGGIAYCVSKMALHGMTRTLAVELAPDRITVNAIAPGNVVTPMNTELYKFMSKQAGGPGEVEHGQSVFAENYPLGRLGKPEDMVVPMVYFASDAAEFVTGQILFVDGGYTSQ